VDAVGVEHLVFGSYSPMFYFESAMLKVQEAALAEEQTVSIFANNALRLLSEASP
jgi:predicted TIM-barrel fold metal-dependent hydrolase